MDNIGHEFASEIISPGMDRSCEHLNHSSTTRLEELEKEVEEKEKELDKQKEYTKKVETEAKQTVIQSMEDEFTCVICHELLLNATTLPCAHSFCELCLRRWLKHKKMCPVCRRKVRVKAFRSVVLDNAISKMIDTMEEGVKQYRIELTREHEEQRREEAEDDSNNVNHLFHRAEDSDRLDERDSEDGYERRGRHVHRTGVNDFRGRRGYRRSGSRSPRFAYHRHRPYHVNTTTSSSTVDRTSMSFQTSTTNSNHSNLSITGGFQPNFENFISLASNSMPITPGYDQNLENPFVYVNNSLNNFPQNFNNNVSIIPSAPLDFENSQGFYTEEQSNSIPLLNTQQYQPYQPYQPYRVNDQEDLSNSSNRTFDEYQYQSNDSDNIEFNNNITDYNGNQNFFTERNTQQ